MPSLSELFPFRRNRQRNAEVNVTRESPAPVEIVSAEIVQSAPQPEIIDVEKHPLRFYPGFDEFAALWNEHASTDTRLGLQQDIQSAQLEADSPPNEISGDLKEKIDSRFEVYREQLKIYDAKEDMPKKQKIRPLRNARRRLRKAVEERDRISQQEKKTRQVADERTEVAKASLMDLDNEFGLELHEDIVKFYVVERLRKGPEDAIDSFLISFSERKELSVREQRPLLWGINLSFFYLLGQYDDTKEKVTGEERKVSADKATNRQLGKRAELQRKQRQ